MHSRNSRLSHFFLFGSLALACAGVAHAAPPDNNPRTSSVPRALPYEGVLAVDGVPLNGTLAVTFSLWGGAVQFAGEQLLYAETLQVPFVNGRFSVLLGEAQQGLADAIFDADALYVGVSVGDTTLRGRQRIVPVPHALWAAKAADFTVEGELALNGSVAAWGQPREVPVFASAAAAGFAQGSIPAAETDGLLVVSFGNSPQGCSERLASVVGFEGDQPAGLGVFQMTVNSDCQDWSQTTSHPVRKGYKYTVFVQSGRVSTRAIFHPIGRGR